MLWIDRMMVREMDRWFDASPVLSDSVGEDGAKVGGRSSQVNLR